MSVFGANVDLGNFPHICINDNSCVVTALFLKSIRPNKIFRAESELKNSKRILDAVENEMRKGGFNFSASYGRRNDLRYSWERLIGSGTSGRVAFFQLMQPEANRGAPQRIAVKFGELEDNLHERSILREMEDVDAKIGYQQCGRIPAVVIDGLRDDVLITVMRPADGSLLDFCDGTMTEDLLVKIVEAIVRELNCIHVTYGMIMVDLKAENILYTCVPNSNNRVNVVFADYGGFAGDATGTEYSGEYSIASTFPPQWEEKQDYFVPPTQSVSLYTLFPLVLSLCGLTSRYLQYEEDRVKRVQIQTDFFEALGTQHEKVSPNMRHFLRFVTGHVHASHRMRITDSHSRAPWYQWGGERYASTYEDALRLLHDLFPKVFRPY